MPEQKTIKRAQKEKAKGRSASTQAGEFVRQEIEHVREGKHGARSTKQAIAIGLSEARRAGVDLPPPKKGSARTKKAAARDSARGKSKHKVSAKRSKASKAALKKEGHAAATPKALARHAKTAAKRRTAAERSASAKRAVRTKGAAGRKKSAKKSAKTRAKKS